ncbi:MAG: hypothetical protein Kow00122_17600 [Thermoleophilia bacterium]
MGREDAGGDGTTATAAPAKRRRLQLWSLPIFLLVLLWLVLAYSSGGFLERQWLLPALATALFALVIFGLGAFPKPPGPLSLAVLVLLLLYGAWVALSAAWAPSFDLAWQETNRTFLYITVFALAATFLVDRTSRSTLRYLLLGAGIVLVAAGAWRLWSGEALSSLFTGGRFYYPVSYPNNAAGLYLILLWPLLGMAADPRALKPIRAAALGTVGSLLALFVMTQSRGGLYALVISGVLLFLLSPTRLRLLFYLLVPGVLLVWTFPVLNGYWAAGAESLSGDPAAYRITMTWAVGAFTGLVLVLLEGWVNVSDRMRYSFAVIALVALGAGLTLGIDQITSQTGSLRTTLERSWDAFVTEEHYEIIEGGSETTRFAVVSSSNRVDLWRVAWNTFREHPWRGIGAEGYIFEFDRHRNVETLKPRQPHSLELRVLSETGIVGGAFFFTALLLGLGGALWPRLSATWVKISRADAGAGVGRWGNQPRAYAWDIALLAGLLYWLIQGSVEWLWHMPGVSIPAFLLLALIAARFDARREWFARARGPAPDSTLENPNRSRILSVCRFSVYRWGGVAVAGVFFVSLFIPYLSLQLRESALERMAESPSSALSSAASAAFLAPGDPEPYHIRADVYRLLARRALATPGAAPAERAGGVLDGLALALHETERAVQAEPAGWTVHYRAAVAALDLLAARRPGTLPAEDLTTAPSAVRWAELMRPVLERIDSGAAPAPPGASPLSPARGGSPAEALVHLRSLSDPELAARGLEHAQAAQSRNPLDLGSRKTSQLLQEIFRMVD